MYTPFLQFWYEVLTIYLALSIQAQVMKWVYTSGTEKRRVTLPIKTTKELGGFFSSLFGSLAGSSNPQRSATPALSSTPEVIDPLAVNETSVSLTVFSASVRVQLEKKLAIEIHRSTKKNPPTQMKLELIYVSPSYSSIGCRLCLLYLRLPRINMMLVWKKIKNIWK